MDLRFGPKPICSRTNEFLQFTQSPNGLQTGLFQVPAWRWDFDIAGAREWALGEGWTMCCHNLFVFPALCQSRRRRVGTDSSAFSQKASVLTWFPPWLLVWSGDNCLLYMSFGQFRKTGWNPQGQGASKWYLLGRQEEWEAQWHLCMSLLGGGRMLSQCCVMVSSEIETFHPVREAA